MRKEKDGVVKYSLEFNQTAIDIKKEFEILETCRKRLYALGLIGVYEDGIGYGNISYRYKNSNEFVITSTQTGHLKSLKDEEYSLVNSVDFENFKTKASGKTKPSSECITHAAIYDLDENINAVIHIHNEKLWNYMLENSYLSTNDTPYGTPEMVDDVINIYKDISPLENNLFVMKGHFEGIVSFGKDINEAEIAIYKLVNKLLT